MTRPSDAAPEQGGEGLREAVEHLANLAAEHLNCSGCPTPWWLTNWLANERTSRRTIAHLEPQAAHTDEGAGLSEAERMHLARCVYAVTGYLPPKNVNDLSGVLNEIEHYVERIVAQRVELANAVPALIAENERLGARLAEVERDANGPGWFWTRTEWAEWSNHLTTLIPEDLFAGNPEGAQESVIEDTITHLVAALVRVTQERDAERAQVARVEALAEEWDRLSKGESGTTAAIRAALNGATATETGPGATNRGRVGNDTDVVLRGPQIGGNDA